GWELVLLDVEVGGGAAAGDRDGHRVERGPELPAGELGGHGRGAFAGVQVEAGGVDERPDTRLAVRRLGHHGAAVGVTRDHDGTGDAVEDAAKVGGVVVQAT